MRKIHQTHKIAAGFCKTDFTRSVELLKMAGTLKDSMGKTQHGIIALLSTGGLNRIP